MMYETLNMKNMPHEMGVTSIHEEIKIIINSRIENSTITANMKKILTFHLSK